MEPLGASLELHKMVQRYSLAARLAARSEWQKINPRGDWAVQWKKRVPKVLAVVESAQTSAAKAGAAAVGIALAEAGYSEPTLGIVIPEAFSGWVTPSWTDGTGVSLDGYLSTPIVSARNATGISERMLEAGGKVLDSLVAFAIVDASAHAHDAQIVATMNAYSVFIEPGSMCPRCAVLAGKRFEPGRHVKRHPRCDAVMEAHSDKADPYKYSFDVGKVRDLSPAQRAAIDAGGNFEQIVNAKRGESRVNGVALTNEGTTRRGVAYKKMTNYYGPFKDSRGRTKRAKSVTRLSPQGIYEQAGSREEMVLLLRKYAYIW